MTHPAARPAIGAVAVVPFSVEHIDPCQAGECGYCHTGRCGHCHGQAIWHPSGYLTDPRGRVIADELGPVMLLPMHRWTCACALDGHSLDPRVCPTVTPAHYGRRCACVPGQIGLF